jgi:hypothetical protein
VIVVVAALAVLYDDLKLLKRDSKPLLVIVDPAETPPFAGEPIL